MFRGSAPAKIDDKGRLKIPSSFRRRLEDRFGRDVFVTSVRGDSALVYPLPTWEELENRLMSMASSDPIRQRFLERTAYFGHEGKLDAQGRILIPQILRETAAMSGEVVVGARLDYLEVWNHDRLRSRFDDMPFTDEDFGYLGERGV